MGHQFQSEKSISQEITNAIDFLLNNDFLERKKHDQLLPTEVGKASIQFMVDTNICLLYTSDAADE